MGIFERRHLSEEDFCVLFNGVALNKWPLTSLPVGGHAQFSQEKFLERAPRFLGRGWEKIEVSTAVVTGGGRECLGEVQREYFVFQILGAVITRIH